MGRWPERICCPNSVRLVSILDHSDLGRISRMRANDRQKLVKIIKSKRYNEVQSIIFAYCHYWGITKAIILKTWKLLVTQAVILTLSEEKKTSFPKKWKEPLLSKKECWNLKALKKDSSWCVVCSLLFKSFCNVYVLPTNDSNWWVIKQPKTKEIPILNNELKGDQMWRRVAVVCLWNGRKEEESWNQKRKRPLMALMG